MKTLTFGGWYQRTTLHLTEIFNFLSRGESNLDLNKTKLKKLLNELNLKSIKRVQGNLERIEIITREGIQIRYYEDGLYVFEIESNEIKKESEKLKRYFEKKWKPAINYLFSLGAPTPKILSNMGDTHPVVIGAISRSPRRIKIDEKIYGKVYSETLSRNTHVFKTKDYIVLVTSKKSKKELNELIDMQIFFREFKIQLHKYLDIHRKVWEDIQKIKEKKSIIGKEADKYRSELDKSQKTIQLIQNRINQMMPYAKTRASLAKNMGVEKELISHFEYKYEDLLNTLDYIKEIWKMTLDYVNSAIEILNEVKTKTAVKGIKSIQLLVSIGAIAGVLKLANPKYIPSISTEVAIFLIVIFGVAGGLDFFMKWNAENKKYKLKFKERDKDI